MWLTLVKSVSNKSCSLTALGFNPCSLMSTYGVIDPGQNWFKLWLDTWANDGLFPFRHGEFEPRPLIFRQGKCYLHNDYHCFIFRPQCAYVLSKSHYTCCASILEMVGSIVNVCLYSWPIHNTCNDHNHEWHLIQTIHLITTSKHFCECWRLNRISSLCPLFVYK